MQYKKTDFIIADLITESSWYYKKDKSMRLSQQTQKERIGMNALLGIVLSIIIYLALVINMAMKPAYSSKLSSTLMIISILGGSIIYGIGYTSVTQDIALSLIRTPFSVIGMFLGKNDLGAISSSPILSGTAGVFCFWTLHLLAFYSIASAAMTTVGAAGLRRLRLFLALNGDLTIIYGIHEDSLTVGKECVVRDKTAVVMINETEPTDSISEIINMGMAVLTGSGAVSCDHSTMLRLRITARKKITVYALHPDRNKNLFYAIAMKEALEKEGVDPKITSITLPGTEDIASSMLQLSEQQYGFGYVQVFDPADMAARAMIRLCPPWDFLSFDDKGRAKENFDCMVIGFGDCGQAALRYLAMNGQFVGSKFHAMVFSPNISNEAGFLLAECPELLKHYAIEFRNADGRSLEFYKELQARLSTLKYIAVCTGKGAMNTEVADNIMLFLKRAKAEHVCVVQVSKYGAQYQEAVGSAIVSKEVYKLDMLSAKREDRNAIILNAGYDSSDRTNWEKWVSCDSFGKMSSRASAEFIPAMIKASGSSREEMLEGKWHPDDEMLHVLGEMEHMRWCAFHFAMGYRPMSEENFRENAENYLRCKQEGLPCSPKIGKDSEKRLHACLVPYDKLDQVSERENAVTGRSVDYKQYDINNVMIIPDILRAQEEERENE